MKVLRSHTTPQFEKEFYFPSSRDSEKSRFRFLPQQEVIYYRIGPHRIYKELASLVV